MVRPPFGSSRYLLAHFVLCIAQQPTYPKTDLDRLHEIRRTHFDCWSREKPVALALFLLSPAAAGGGLASLGAALLPCPVRGQRRTELN